MPFILHSITVDAYELSGMVKHVDFLFLVWMGHSIDNNTTGMLDSSQGNWQVPPPREVQIRKSTRRCWFQILSHGK